MNITIYSKDSCPMCENVARTLDKWGIPFTKKMLGEDYTKEELLAIAPGAKSLPQCVVDGKVIGNTVKFLAMVVPKAV